MARNLVQVVIAVGSTASAIAQGSGMTPVGLYVPANLTGTMLTFNAYGAGGQFGNLVTDGAGSAVTKTLKSATDQYVDLSADLVGNGIDGLQVVSGSSQSTNPAVLTVVFK